MVRLLRAAAAARARRVASSSACGSGRTPLLQAAASPPPARRGLGDVEPLRLFYADWAKVPLPEGHRFPMEKYAACRALLEGDASLEARVALERSPLAPLEALRRVHCAEYVERVVSGGLSESEQRRVGFPWSEAHVRRSLASTGGTLAATRHVLDGGARVAAQMAGGTHHAFRSHGEGFCVFNDMAVAAADALAGPAGRLRGPVLVLDLDVHQGNGTNSFFEDEPRVVTFDMHGAGNYPWKTRTTSTHDVPLEDGTGDEVYLSTLAEWLPYLFDTYRPGLVFFQAGVDALEEDSFGRLSMTRAGLLQRNNMVYSACISHDVPLVIVAGGGYSRPFDASVAAHADVFRSAAFRFTAAAPPVLA